MNITQTPLPRGDASRSSSARKSLTGRTCRQSRSRVLRLHERQAAAALAAARQKIAGALDQGRARRPPRHRRDTRRARADGHRRATARSRSTTRSAWSSTSKATRSRPTAARAVDPVPSRGRSPKAEPCDAPTAHRAASRLRRAAGEAGVDTSARLLGVSRVTRSTGAGPGPPPASRAAATTRSRGSSVLGVSRIVIDAGPWRPRSRRPGQRRQRSRSRARRRAAAREAARAARASRSC